MAMLFQISDLTVHYQKVAALKGISIGLADGDIVTLIGANGAGKSTTLRAISGLARPSAGEISFEGRRIDGLRPEQIVALIEPLRERGFFADRDDGLDRRNVPRPSFAALRLG